MTNDSRKGWRYKLRTDANQRRRREPDVRRRTEHYRREAKQNGSWYCHSRSRTPHRGELEVQHVGGIKRDQKRQRFSVMCEAHNQRDAGNHPDHQPRARLRASRDPRDASEVWFILALVAGAAALALAL